jgi:phospho-N-acetylmuramoyl-pentapeptide-transferase
MARVLIAGLIAMVIAVAVGPYFIAWLKRQSIGQQIREEGPVGHVVKAGTPTMGGLLILVAALIPALAVSLYTIPGLTIILATVGCGLIGFADDYLKVRRRRSLGLQGRWKMLGLVLITAGVAWATTQVGYMDTEIYFPLVDVNIDLHWLYFPFLFLVIAGTSNAVNLTDGIDGLAAGTCAISLITLLAIALIDWLRSADTVANRSHEYLDLAIVAAALIGGVIGFLWFNAFPAEMFMGDTGSMALGGAIATLAILTETEVLLVFIGGVFVIEAVTWIIQIASFKRTGRRVFLIVPIHHHFEMKAWSETKIMVRFWIVGAILCAVGFALYYRYYLRFQLE